MKRLLLIFMLLFVPLQATWAAVNAYCNLEQGAAAQHLGHHGHDEHLQPQSDEGSDRSPLTQPDPDCANCQVGILMSIGELPSSINTAVPDRSPLHFLLSSLPERPERPKWMLAA